ncbi:MAG TPA: Hpt domain-containing protein [Allosphingosinicella sp.]|jgi:HPt (histidine-containing phosphotransfer) domain-containing protein
MWTQEREEESAPGSNADGIVDWGVFSQVRSEMGSGFIRMLGYFREDGEKAVVQIEQAMRRKDAAALVTPADTLKVEARQFGAEPLAELAEEIEELARHALEMRVPPDDLLPAVVKLRSLYRRTVALFDQEANPLQQRRPASRSEAANQDFGRI